MSSRVNIDLCLIAANGLLPTVKLHEVFMETLKELNGTIINGVLSINNQQVGKISLKERIVVQTYSELTAHVEEKTNELREVFTRRASLAIEDYKSELVQEKKKLEQSDMAYNELIKRIHEVDEKIENQNRAIEKQQMTFCEAMVLELKEAAENQGYDIVEEETEEGVQLQFVRRVY